jgi:uncharacterized protein YbjT (DUF2867 family)
VNVLVVGATGALGRVVVERALARDHSVTVLARNAAAAGFGDGVRVVEGDVLKPETLGSAVEGQDAVVCVLGTPSPRQATTLLEEGTRNLVEAMKSAAVRRLVCVTLLGTGDSRRNAAFMYRSMILRVLAPMVPDKERQEEVVRGSGLDWVIVRPPRFTGGTKRPRVIRAGESGRVGQVSRHGLAETLLDAAERDDYVGQAVVVGS